MPDLYLLLVPIYAAIAVSALIALKAALSENSLTAHVLTKVSPSQQKVKAKEEEESSPFKTTISHFLLNLTLL